MRSPIKICYGLWIYDNLKICTCCLTSIILSWLVEHKLFKNNMKLCKAHVLHPSWNCIFRYCKHDQRHEKNMRKLSRNLIHPSWKSCSIVMFTTSMVQMKYSVSIRVISHFAVQSNQEIYNNFKLPVTRDILLKYHNKGLPQSPIFATSIFCFKLQASILILHSDS